MKDVMISIQPRWCKLIANGEKTIEVRKTRPNIEMPFKCRIYCSKNKDKYFLQRYNGKIAEVCSKVYTKQEYAEELADKKLNGKVIGEFVCDDIDKIFVHNDVVYCVSNTQPNKLKQMCLSVEELKNYLVVNPNIASTLNAVDTNTGYAWHIIDLKIYDEPKGLSEFGISRPPQSWCYCEELEENENGK